MVAICFSWTRANQMKMRTPNSVCVVYMILFLVLTDPANINNIMKSGLIISMHIHLQMARWYFKKCLEDSISFWYNKIAPYIIIFINLRYAEEVLNIDKTGISIDRTSKLHLPFKMQLAMSHVSTPYISEKQKSNSCSTLFCALNPTLHCYELHSEIITFV